MKIQHRQTKGKGLISAARPLLLAAALAVLPATDLVAAQPAPAKQPAPASQPAAPQYTAQQKEFMANLDKLIAEQNYPLFMQTITKADTNDLVNAALDWGKARTLEGAGVVVPATYSALLWATAEVDTSNTTLRNTSSLMALYAILVVAADGPKCADATAPENHMNNLLQQYQRQIDAVSNLPADQKRMAIEMAVSLERRIAPKRQNDKYLCRFGAQEQADIAKAAGKPAALDYTPQFRPREQWEPEQNAKRAAFTEFLNTLLKPAQAK